MARIQRFEDLALEAIKSAVVNFYRESVKRVPHHLPQCSHIGDSINIQDVSLWYHTMKQRLPDVVPVETAIMETVKHSAYGWEHITQSLVQLGVTLIESSPAPTSSSGASAAVGVAATAHGATSSTQLPATASPSSFGALVIELGMNVLLETFRIHEMVRPAILEQIFSHVVSFKLLGFDLRSITLNSCCATRLQAKLGTLHTLCSC